MNPQAEGHFPGNPIIPGAVLLREIVSVLPDRERHGLLRDPLSQVPPSGSPW